MATWHRRQAGGRTKVWRRGKEGGLFTAVKLDPVTESGSRIGVFKMVLNVYIFCSIQQTLVNLCALEHDVCYLVA